MVIYVRMYVCFLHFPLIDCSGFDVKWLNDCRLNCLKLYDIMNLRPSDTTALRGTDSELV